MYAALLASFCAGAAVSYVSARGAVRAAVAEVVAEQRWQAIVQAAGYAARPVGVGARVAAGVAGELARAAAREGETLGWAPGEGDAGRGIGPAAPRAPGGRFGLRIRVRD